jgi:acyl-CoA thioester hydrolase
MNDSRSEAAQPSHEIQLRVRYDDSDPMGFLHHAKYFTYFEIARTEMLRAMGGNYRKMEEAGLLAVVVKAECKYQKPARYDDVLTVRVNLRAITAAKIEHEYTVMRDHERLAIGHVVLALVDRSGQIQRVPDWLKNLGS